MAAGGWWLSVCALWILVAQSSSIKQCLDGVMINVILLNDENFPWSLKYVEGEILRAIEKNADINSANNMNFSLKANFAGIDTSYYKKAGCESSMCEGVAEFRNLSESGMLGCAVLGPSCTLSTHQMVDGETGLKIKTPFLSAGSFGLSCDGTSHLQRLLPPARKITHFFFEFWNYQNKLKNPWKKAYVYKKKDIDYNTEDCFWYTNALDAGDTDFGKTIMKKAIRSPEELKYAIDLGNRMSNLFIMCGSPADVKEAKRGVPEADNADILFFLIDLYNDQYYFNKTSMPHMRNVLVLTMPNDRNYTISNTTNYKMNDYMAAYHDAVLLIGEVMRKLMPPESERRIDPYVNASLFRNTSFNGIAGNYRLDPQGDRDVTFSVIYTTLDDKYEKLFTFDTETSYTHVEKTDPAFIWGKRLPNDTPDRGPQLEDIIVTVLAVAVVVVATIAFIFYRQVTIRCTRSSREGLSLHKHSR